MPIGTPTLLTADDNTNASLSRSTAAITPTPGSIVNIAWYAQKSASGGSLHTLTPSTSMGGTWQFDALSRADAATGFRDVLYIWRARVPEDAGTGTISATASLSCNRWSWSVWEETGSVEGFNDNHDEVFDNVGTTSFTLPQAPAAESVVYAVIATIGDANGVNVGSGFTQISENTGTPTSLQVQYDPAPADASIGWTGSTAPENIMIAYEVEAAVSGGAMVVVVGI